MSTQEETTATVATLNSEPKPKAPRKRLSKAKKPADAPAPAPAVVEPIEQAPEWADEPLYVPPVQTHEEEEEGRLVPAEYPYEHHPTGWSFWDVLYSFLGGFVAGAFGTLALTSYMDALEEKQILEARQHLYSSIMSKAAGPPQPPAEADAPQEPIQP